VTEREVNLFRRESGRLLATLTRIFGVHNLPLAEDVVQDALCRALEVWKLRGVPDDPAAWLLTTAKHRALDSLRRERTARAFAPELGRLLESEWTLVPTLDAEFEPHAIKDDQLRMMLSCCHPKLTEDVQVALVLHILCGFSVGEIAGAFLATRAAIEKRLARGKKVLAGSKRLFDLVDAEAFPARLVAVQRALYLLFNEGYHGACETQTVRVELCEEAMRLLALLSDYPLAATPPTQALGALMCLHAARIPARLDAAGDLVPLARQDRALWDRKLVADGERLLSLAATGDDLTDYHVEAAIAAVHASAPRAVDTDWATVVSLYDTLLRIRPSPVAALGRAIAVAERDGPERGLAEIGTIEDRARLDRYPFYAAALGELELRRGRRDAARTHFESAAALARSPAERRFLERRAQACHDTG
jgi:RNA polymerase sigma factor (sigma-70 family)